MIFDAGSFTDLAGTELGIRLWEFINERESVVRMETATYLSRPALEALQPALIERFGSEVNNEHNDRVKQMLGRMARQVMEHYGYELDQKNVTLRRRELFLKAALYR